MHVAPGRRTKLICNLENHRCTQNSVKRAKMLFFEKNVLQPLTILRKNSFLDVLLVSEYISKKFNASQLLMSNT